MQAAYFTDEEKEEEEETPFETKKKRTRLRVFFALPLSWRRRRNRGSDWEEGGQTGQAKKHSVSFSLLVPLNPPPFPSKKKREREKERRERRRRCQAKLEEEEGITPPFLLSLSSWMASNDKRRRRRRSGVQAKQRAMDTHSPNGIIPQGRQLPSLLHKCGRIPPPPFP